MSVGWAGHTVSDSGSPLWVSSLRWSRGVGIACGHRTRVFALPSASGLSMGHQPSVLWMWRCHAWVEGHLDGSALAAAVP